MIPSGPLVTEVDRDPTLQRLAERVGRALGVPTCLVALTDPPGTVPEPRHTFAAWTDLPTDLRLTRSVPLSWTPCEEVVRGGELLSVSDTRRDPRTQERALVADGIVRAYLGAPLVVPGVGIVGTLCVLSPDVREFGETDRLVVELAAESASRLVALRGDFGRAPIEADADPDADARPTPQPGRPTADPDEPSDPPSDPPSDEVGFAVGRRIGDRWRVTAALGEGGQGSVWLAREGGSGRLVAVKIADRALAEAQALASVSHPNLVAVHAAGPLEGDRSFLVMDYVRGQTLSDAVSAGMSMPSGSVPWIEHLTQVAGALTALHARQLAHGDVKASNVIVDDVRQVAVLVDLGLGLRLGMEIPGAGCGGTVRGSAPEQFGTQAGERLTPAADTYGIATLAWTLLTGEPPFSRPTRLASLYAQMTGALEPVPRTILAFRPVFEQALSSDPTRRHPSPLAFVTALHRELRGTAGVDTSIPTTSAAVIRGVRAAASRLGDKDAEARATGALPSKVQEQWRASDTSETPLPSDAVMAWLRAWANRSSVRLHELGHRSGAATGRHVVRQAHVLFEPANLLASLTGLLPRMHTWAHLALDLDSPQSARGTLMVPSRWQETVLPFLAGSLVGMFSAAGADLSLEWTDGPSRETVGLWLQWRETGGRSG